MATVDDLKDGVYSASIPCILSQTDDVVGEGFGEGSDLSPWPQLFPLGFV